MVTIDKLKFSIKGKVLIQGLSAQFEKGKIHLILGPNGAGKSTLVKLIGGEIKPTSGEVLLEQKKLQNISLAQLAKFRAVLSQNIDLSFPLSVQEVVMMGRYPHFENKPDRIDREICAAAMQFFNVNEMKDRNYLTLSGGEKQRVQFARVFAQIWEPVEGRSRLLLLDEPLTFLDIYYQYDLMKKVKGFLVDHPDLTVIGVVHDLNIAAKFADQVMLLKDGSIYDFGNAPEVMTEKGIFDVFSVKVRNGFEIE